MERPLTPAADADPADVYQAVRGWLDAERARSAGARGQPALPGSSGATGVADAGETPNCPCPALAGCWTGGQVLNITGFIVQKG